MFVVEDYEQKQWEHSAATIFSCLFSGSSAGRRSADRWGLSFVLIWDLLESCFRSVQVFSSPFLSVWQKRSPRLLSAGLLWTVRSAGFVFLWWILDVWDLQQVVWLARSVLTLTEEHISLFGWFHSALIEVQQGAPPLQLFTWLCRSDTGSSLFWLELIKSLIYRFCFSCGMTNYVCLM